MTKHQKKSLFCVRIDHTCKNHKPILLTIFVAIMMFSLQAILIPPSLSCIDILHCPSIAEKCGSQNKKHRQTHKYLNTGIFQANICKIYIFLIHQASASYLIFFRKISGFINTSYNIPQHLT